MPDIRTELKKLRRLGLELEEYPERIARLRSAMEGLNRVMRNSPAGSAFPTDKLAKQMAELDELEQLYAADVIDHERGVRKLEHLLEVLPETQHQVMRLRYVRGLSWRGVAKELSYSVDHCGELHKEALKKMPDNAGFFCGNI